MKVRAREVLSLGLHEVGENWPLINYLVADEVYRAQYVNRFAAVQSFLAAQK